MFEDVDNKEKQNKTGDKNREADKMKNVVQPGSVPPRENLNLGEGVDLSKVSTIPSPKNEKKDEEFGKRIQYLHDKGKRRGILFAVIGLVVGICISVGTVYLIDNFKGDVQEMSDEIDRQEKEPIEAIIDPENFCDNDYCCLASLRRIKKNNYIIVDEGEDCPIDHAWNALKCINSLAWCEPSAIVDLEEDEATTTFGSTEDEAIIASSTPEGDEFLQEAFEKNIDSDNDGLGDVEEREYGTDINNSDTDGDGFLDGDEVDGGYDPLGEGSL
ncbi:MAG: hypothetical protein U9Q85_04355 [Patescibacteria group bacterium]|nr:hypothetical protein [Patescibacteria group bacterium]